MTLSARISELTRRLRPALLFTLALPLAVGCSGGPTEGVLGDLDRAEALWARTNGNASYTMDQRRNCFCPPPRGAKITVVNNVVTSGIALDSARALTALELSGFRTVRQIFAYIRQTLALKDARVDVTYDAATGYPKTLYTDPYPMAADDELGFEITALVKLSN